MYEMDTQVEGFEWINADDNFRSIFSFVRHSADGKNNLLFVCNFTPVEREDYRVGVPESGTYTLVLDSDEERFGGSGVKHRKTYKAEEQDCDNREYSIAYKLSAFGVAVFKF